MSNEIADRIRDAEKRIESEQVETGVMAFDPLDPDAVCDAILDLGARLTEVERKFLINTDDDEQAHLTQVIIQTLKKIDERSMKDNKECYALTWSQEKAFNDLARAIRKCVKLNIYMFDYYGTITAVNGNVVEDIAPAKEDDSYVELDYDQVSDITDYNFQPTADDQQYVKLKKVHSPKN